MGGENERKDFAGNTQKSVLNSQKFFNACGYPLFPLSIQSHALFRPWEHYTPTTTKKSKNILQIKHVPRSAQTTLWKNNDATRYQAVPRTLTWL